MTVAALGLATSSDSNAGILISAGTNVSCFANISVAPFITNKTKGDSDQNTTGDPISKSASADASLGEGMSGAVATARADFASVGVSLTVSAFGEPPDPTQSSIGGTGTTNGSASATYRENAQLLVKNVPALHPIVMRSVLFLHADIFKGFSSGTGDAQIRLSITDLSTSHALPPAPYDGNLWGGIGTGVLGIDQFPPALVFEDHEMLNGLDYTLGWNMFLTGFASSGGNGSANAAAILSNSLSWGGIVEVRDGITGEVYTDWTITSESGFDYSKPFVPEPASCVLLLCGVTGLRLPREARRRKCRLSKPTNGVHADATFPYSIDAGAGI